ncbi:uncharacterized protein Nmlp_1989 [Natronomonas moolapensis 8.8.11]|uniref:Uncharacterized protein n=1 Tax=Natronomonas moolapensis (strain DSM 18674 / CECT 7526 / JCM 14361 / 8.8.11) TaxID=268739 RepID=M1XKM6_NATM8|nr:uncharacterized protein Nmlp_1989 [Natronomonas moolapensis 8.8.11]
MGALVVSGPSLVRRSGRSDTGSPPDGPGASVDPDPVFAFRPVCVRAIGEQLGCLIRENVAMAVERAGGFGVNRGLT